jgi:hypothetical protein
MNLKHQYRPAEVLNTPPNTFAPPASGHALVMVDHPDTAHPPDICLILRAHGEQRWLVSKVVPIVRQLEQRDLVPEDQIGAALAYLEVLWLDACSRAAETDAALAQLDRQRAEGDLILYEKARRYHAAVRRLRAAVARRVSALTGAPCETPALADF